MARILLIFNKAISLPDDSMRETKTYGLTFEKTERATFERIEKYIKEYLLVVADLFKEGIEHIDEWSYRRNGKTFYVDGPMWWEYVRKAQKKKIRFAIIDDEKIEIKADDLYDNYLFLNKDKWEKLRETKEIVWHN